MSWAYHAYYERPRDVAAQDKTDKNELNLNALKIMDVIHSLYVEF